MELPRKRPAENRLMLLLVVAIAWFYLWTVAPEGLLNWAPSDNHGYYNLLTKGFLKGQLSLDTPVDPYLAQLKDPWDPAQRAGHGLHDASYYHGRYYIYFGVTPVVLLFLPFHLLTGHYIDEPAACLLFSLIGLLFSIAAFRSVRNRFFPQGSATAFLGGVFALGLIDMMPALLRRPGIWEVPITCAYACFMVALWSLDAALHRQHRDRWLAVASVAIGLAIGARPVYLPALLALGFVVYYFTDRSGGWGLASRHPAWRRMAACAFGPVVAIGAGLALYNLLRFGSPFEFGQHYEMSGANTRNESYFGWSFLVYGFRLYWLAAANWSHFFPYVLPITTPPQPAGLLGVEDPYGILPNLPFVAWGLVLLAWAGARGRLPERSLKTFVLGAFVAVLGIMGMVMAFGAVINRYMVDFLPGLTLLAVIGLVAAAGWGTRSRAGRWALGVGTAVLLAYSGAFSVLASIRHNELLRVEHPVVYKAAVHTGNKPSHKWDEWAHEEYGPIEMAVVFPRNVDGTNEPLVATGWGFLSDYLFVHYAGKDLVQFGLEHTSRTLLLGEPVHIQAGVPHLLRIDMGSLYPPPGHPYFDLLDPAQARLRPTTLAVSVDGEPALRRVADFYDAQSPFPTIGQSGGRPGYPKPFSGKIQSWRRLPGVGVSAPPATKELTGALELDVVLPPFAGVHNDPLLSTGETGRGDLIFLRYVGPGQVAIGYDHWSMGGPTSDPIDVDPAAVQKILIDTAAINANNAGRLVIRLNGKVVFDQIAPYYPCAPETIAIGNNAIHASTASDVFAGRIVRSQRVDP